MHEACTVVKSWAIDAQQLTENGQKAEYSNQLKNPRIGGCIHRWLAKRLAALGKWPDDSCRQFADICHALLCFVGRFMQRTPSFWLS
jgi:hypothetical protein